MNERIEAYLKQHHCRDYFTSYGETVRDDHYFMYREEVEGLIELIIRECAGVCEDYRGTEWGKVAECIGDRIKERFGVE